MECHWENEFDYVMGFHSFEEELGGLGEAKDLVEDSGSQEVVKGTVKKMKKEKKKSVYSDKSIVALKSHSEAERRRRERINGHLATLHGLLPSKAKMDKATLLAEVINQVKDLQEHAIRVSKGLLIPMAADELTVEPLFVDSKRGVMALKASVCCDLRPDLFLDLKQAITSLRLKTHHSEISTLGERVKTLLILSSFYDVNSINNAEALKNLPNAVHQALSSVLCKPPPLPEYSLRTTLSRKRFETSFEDYSPQSVLSNKRFKFSPSGSSSSVFITSTGTGSYPEPMN